MRNVEKMTTPKDIKRARKFVNDREFPAWKTWNRRRVRRKIRQSVKNGDYYALTKRANTWDLY